jgi:hypothetical protein
VAPQVSPRLHSVLCPSPVPVLQRGQLEGAGGGGEEGGGEVRPARGGAQAGSGPGGHHWHPRPAHLQSQIRKRKAPLPEVRL